LESLDEVLSGDSIISSGFTDYSKLNFFNLFNTSVKTIYLVVLCLLIISCKEQYSAQLIAASKPPHISRSGNSYTLKLTDSLTIPLPKGVPPYFEYSNFLYNDSLYYFSYANHKLGVVDIVNERVDSIILPKDLISGDILSINVINKDSILMIQDNTERLILIKNFKDFETILLPKIDFTNSDLDFQRLTSTLADDQANFLVDYRNLEYDPRQKLVHIGLQPLDAYISEGFEESERIAAYDLSTQKWDFFYAPPKGMMKHRGSKSFSYPMSQKNIFLKGDTMFVSYVNDHYVYYYQDGDYKGRIPAISTSAKDMFLPLATKDLEDVEDIKSYMGSAPKYGMFHFHSKLKLYSRIYFDQQEFIDANGRYKPMHLFRDVYAILLDEEFNHVGEFKFPYGSMEFLGAEPMSDGFALFATKHNDRDSLNSTFKLKYIYKIDPIHN